MLDGRLVIIFDGWLIDLDALGFNDISNPMLEACKISGRKGIGFRNDWNQVDTGAQALHDFDVQRLQGVTGGADEVEAGMDSKIDLVLSPGLLLLQHVGFVLVVEEFDDWHPGIAIVDIVAKTRGVDHRQTHYHRQLRSVYGKTISCTFEELFLQLSLCNLNLNSLINLLGMASLVVLIVLDGGGEEGVDEGGLAQA